MNTNELLRHREILLAKAQELKSLLRGRDIKIESVADPLDEVQLAVERELEIESANVQSDMLADIRAAVGRIDDGSFGLCVDCEDPIAPRRLAAVPWASRCLHCQETFEATRGREDLDDVEELDPHEKRRALRPAA